jgi:hypothetical protein
MPGYVQGADPKATRKTGRYGVRHHKQESPPVLTRLHDAVGKRYMPGTLSVRGVSDFDENYPWSEIKLCNVLNGAVTVYSDKPGFSRTPAAPADVMVEIPAYYYKVEDTATTREYEILGLKPSKGFTNKPDGYHVSPRHAPHIGAPLGYERIYVGAYTSGSDYRSVSGGSSLVSVTRPTCRTGCANRGADYWQYDFATHCTITMLCMIETADLNSQTAVGRGIADTTAQIARGNADAIPGHTGGGGTNRAMKYRDIENLWGNIWQWCDGINFNGALSYINLDPATYADDTANNYTQVSFNKAPADGWIRELGHDPALPWLFIPTLANSADGQFFSDHYWQAAGWRALILGGNWNNAGNVGLFCFNANNAASNVNTNIGCRLFV